MAFETKPQASSPAVVELLEPELTQERIELFRAATRSEHSQAAPPTLATVFRAAEFEWLRKLGVDMRRLLHIEQRYDYVGELRPGAKPLIRTKISGLKERKSRQGTLMKVELTSEVLVEGQVCVIATTGFLVRTPKPLSGEKPCDEGAV